jgi:hypothetical protein
MKGSLILDRIHDPELQREWHRRLDQLHAALENLNRVRQAPDRKAVLAEYLEAVLQFAEARDHERTFFWDTFVEERVQA